MRYYTRDLVLYNLFGYVARLTARIISSLISLRADALVREDQQQIKLEAADHPLFEGWRG